MPQLKVTVGCGLSPVIVIEIVDASNAQAVSDTTVTVITSPSLALEAEVALSEASVTVRPGSVAFTSILVVSDAPLVARAVSASLLYKSFIVPPLRSIAPR
jgi:16S rRNA C1402 (ribose-2'-O) methylase RsmI